MTVNVSNLMSLLSQKVSYLNQNQEVLAQNVANADTPGYKARELAPFTFDNAMKQASFSMATTDSRHIVPASLAGSNAHTTKSDSYDVVPTGNSVNLEEQMMSISKNGIDYQEVTGIMRSVLGLFKLAIKGSTS